MSGDNEDAYGHLPDGWCWSRFSDVATIASNLVSPKEWGNAPHVAPDNIERDTGRLLPYRTISEDAVTSPKHLFGPGQLLYSKIRPYLNKCVRVDFRGLCSADMYPLNARVDSSYLHYYILSGQFVSAVSRASGSRTVLPKTNREQLSEVPVPIAPLREQRRIADAVESYFTRLDNSIATLERVARNLKRYRASVLKAAVEARLVPTEAALAKQEGRAYEPASVFLQRVLAERRRRWSESGRKGKYQEPASPNTAKLSPLPKGWCWATVDQLAEQVTYGSSAKTRRDLASGVPVLRMGNIIEGYLDYSELKYLPSDHCEFPDLLLFPGDLLFNRTNSPELVGKAAVVAQDIKSSFASYLVRVRFAEGVQSQYVAYFVNSPAGRQWIRSVVSQQVGQANVNASKLKSCLVPLPPRDEQTRIVEGVERVFSLVFATGHQVKRDLERCQRLRQSILKWAFEGRLADQDPSDEPASILLERIKAEREAADPTTHRQRRGTGKKQVRA